MNATHLHVMNTHTVLGVNRFDLHWNEVKVIWESERTWLLLQTFTGIAVSHKDWELPNSRIWLAVIDIGRGQGFPI